MANENNATGGEPGRVPAPTALDVKLASADSTVEEPIPAPIHWLGFYRGRGQRSNDIAAAPDAGGLSGVESGPAFWDDAEVAIWSVDRQYRIVTFNPAARSQLTPPRGGTELKPGQNALDLVAKTVRPLWASHYQRSFAGEQVSLKSRLRADGRGAGRAVSIYPIHTGDGVILGATVFAWPVRTAKQTASMPTRPRPAPARKAALYSTPLAIISHEFRTQLGSVMGMAELLQDTPLTDTQRGYVQVIDEAAEVLLALVNDSLDYARFEAGRLTLTEREFDPTQVVNGTLAAMAPKAAAKGIQLSSRFAADFPSTWLGDPTRLRQVLTNLVGNAIKFTADGEVTVRGAVQGQAQASRRLRFEVGDTGIGIPRPALRRLFKPFSQAHPSIASEYGGTGLGLYVAKMLVEMMGGQIAVRSTPGRGSAFRFTIGQAGAAGESPEQAGGFLGEDRLSLAGGGVVFRQATSIVK